MLALGGQGDASAELEGVSCDAGIPDVPQPYGEEEAERGKLSPGSGVEGAQ